MPARSLQGESLGSHRASARCQLDFVQLLGLFVELSFDLSVGFPLDFPFDVSVDC
jgi:hypothetical protein